METRICKRPGCEKKGVPLPLFQIQGNYRKKPQSDGTMCIFCARKAYHDKAKLKRFAGKSRCSACNGTGGTTRKSCKTCDGTGWIRIKTSAPSRGG